MKTVKILMTISIVFLSLNAKTYAVEMQGEIKEINLQNQTLKMNKQEEREIKIDSQTHFEGAAFDELRIGDEIRVEAKQEKNIWTAKRVQLDKVNIRNQNSVRDQGANENKSKGEVL